MFELEHLSAYNNEITELDLTGLSNLKTVYVPYNEELSNIDIKDCWDLEDLNVSSSEIEELDLTNNRKLKHLNCDNTLIRELNINDLSELETLYCFKCYLSKLDCSGLKKLKNLNCAGNNNLLSTFKRKARIKAYNLGEFSSYNVEGIENLKVTRL